MATRTLYLTSGATASPYPTTSRLLSETANASEVTLGPGEFDSGLPGTSDAGQWNPSSPIADTTAAAEIDNAGAVPGVTRQGWLFDSDLSNMILAAGAWSFQLRLRANQGSGTSARIVVRVSIVTATAGLWTTVATLFTTRVTGSQSVSGGQAGWRDQNQARVAPTTTAANFSVTVGDGATVLGHTFAAGERILVEFGFCDGDSTTDRTWRLDFNTSNSFVTTPDISASQDGNASGSIGTATLVAPEATSTGGASASSTIGTSIVSSPEATSTGASDASGTIGTLQAVPVEAIAGADANAAAPVGTSSIGSIGATSAGAGDASGSVGSVDALAPTATASADDGNASGDIGIVTLTAVEGTGSGDAAVSGAVSNIIPVAPEGTSVGSSEASGEIGVSVVSAASANASGVAEVSGAVGLVAISPCDGTASGDGVVDGSLSTAVVSQAEANAEGDAAAEGIVGVIAMTAIEGTLLPEAMAHSIMHVIARGVQLSEKPWRAIVECGSFSGPVSYVTGGFLVDFEQRFEVVAFASVDAPSGAQILISAKDVSIEGTKIRVKLYGFSIAGLELEKVEIGSGTNLVSATFRYTVHGTMRV